MGQVDVIPGLSPSRALPDPGGPARGGADSGRFPEPLLAALRRAADRGAWVLSVCSGVFVLGEAGLLEGRRCTTHWRHTAELAHRYPGAKVDPGVLYVDEQPVITSAGTAAGALTPACTWCARNRARAWPTGSRAAWSCPRTATAARLSTSTARSPKRPAAASARCSNSWRATSGGRLR